MNSKRRSISWSPAIALLFVMVFGGPCHSQEPKPISEAELRALIKMSLSKDYKAADGANKKLSELTVRDLPILGIISKQGTTCERMKAAQSIVDFNKDNKTLIPVLIELSTAGNESSSEDELLCRRGATFLLAFSSDGIRVLADMLKNAKNLFIRRSAIFAFDELTETGNYPEGGLDAMKAAIPIIADSAKLKDQVMRHMSNEVLWQLVRKGDKDLSIIAKRFVSDNPR